MHTLALVLIAVVAVLLMTYGVVLIVRAVRDLLPPPPRGEGSPPASERDS